jgi:phage shock protein C
MTAASTAPRTLYRSTRDSKIAGVCGGIAEAMGWDPTVVRLVAALSLLLPGPQAIAYLVAWIVLPTDQKAFGWTDQRPAEWPAQPPAPPTA